MQAVLQFIPKVFSAVQVRALCRTFEFFDSKLDKPCLRGAHFVHRGMVTLEVSVKGNNKGNRKLYVRYT